MTPAPKLLAFALAPLLALALVACGGGGADEDELFPRVLTLGEGEVFANITNFSLVVGPNRFSMMLTDVDDEVLLDADVSFEFYDLNGDEPELKAQADARRVVTDLARVDERAGETVVSGENGVYVADVQFDHEGDWGVIVSVTRDGRQLDPIPFRFNVLEDTPEPRVGDPAPPSRQATLAEVQSIDEIDSSHPPRPHMHETTIADALESGRPLVVAFATPAYCESRICAPVMDTVMDPLYERYGEQAAFIHVEPFRLDRLRAGIGRDPVPAMREWNLRTEPWIFVVDARGRVVARFDGIIGFDEVEGALAPLLPAG
jgi:hypothetical protein